MFVDDGKILLVIGVCVWVCLLYGYCRCLCVCQSYRCIRLVSSPILNIGETNIFRPTWNSIIHTHTHWCTVIHTFKQIYRFYIHHQMLVIYQNPFQTLQHFVCRSMANSSALLTRVWMCEYFASSSNSPHFRIHLRFGLTQWTTKTRAIWMDFIVAQTIDLRLKLFFFHVKMYSNDANYPI